MKPSHGPSSVCFKKAKLSEWLFILRRKNVKPSRGPICFIYKEMKPPRGPQLSCLQESETFSSTPTVFVKNVKPSWGFQMFYF